jgi:transposase
MKRLLIRGKESIKKQIQLYFAGNDEAKYIQRLHAILLFIEKEAESCDSVGDLLGHSLRTISNWIKRINESGDIACLRSRKQAGRPSRLSDVQRQELRLVTAKALDIEDNKWDGNRLSAYITGHYGITMRPRTCQRLFHQLGIRPKRAYRSVSEDAKEKKGATGKKLDGNEKY